LGPLAFAHCGMIGDAVEKIMPRMYFHGLPYSALREAGNG